MFLIVTYFFWNASWRMCMGWILHIAHFLSLILLFITDWFRIGNVNYVASFADFLLIEFTFIETYFNKSTFWSCKFKVSTPALSFCFLMRFIKPLSSSAYLNQRLISVFCFGKGNTVIQLVRNWSFFYCEHF